MKKPLPARLYHYCCWHSAVDIRRDMAIKPARTLLDERGYQHIASPPAGSILWLTDMYPPDRDALGLSMVGIRCDRMQFAFEVAPDYRYVQWWMRYRRQHPEMWELETEPGVLPVHWYVCEVPVTVTREVAP